MPENDDLTSAQERRELINDITKFSGVLDDILKEFLPTVKKHPISKTCHCPILHVTLSDISSGNDIFCAISNDIPLPHNYYDDLTSMKYWTNAAHSSALHIRSHLYFMT